MSFKKHIMAINEAKTDEEKEVQTQIAVCKVLRTAMSNPARMQLQARPWILDVISGHVGPEARGSVFTNPDTLDKVFSLVVDTTNVWTLKSAENGVAIFQWKRSVPVGVVRAVTLESVDGNLPVKVEALGDHPTLVPVNDDPELTKTMEKTGTITMIVEYEGPAYEKDVEELMMPRNEGLLAAVFPGEPLPPSRPHDCSEGDCMTAETALEKGWKVLKLK